MITFLNPTNVHTPKGPYTHTAVVPAGSQLIFIAGQVGMRPDGSVPTSAVEQAEVLFGNLAACLEAHELGMSSIVKITTYLVSGTDLTGVRDVRDRYFNGHCPTATALFVPSLGSPEYLLEVEATAVRSV